MFIRYCFENGYFENLREQFDSDDDDESMTSLIDLLTESNTILEKVEFEYTDTIDDYDNTNWKCSRVSGHDVFMIGKCIERILPLNMLTKASRKTLWKHLNVSLISIMSLYHDGGV